MELSAIHLCISSVTWKITTKQMEQLLTYGLYAGKLRHISEVENGLACNCICPNCKKPLIAKNNLNNFKIAHFAHKSNKECDRAIETALHILVKEILLKTKRLLLPKYHFDYNHFNKDSIFKECCELVFESITLEKTFKRNGESIIPDVIGEIRERKIFIEFANTHFIDAEKVSKLKAIGIACIEIDLKEQILDEKSLTAFLSSDSPFKYWITNPKLDNEYITYKKKQNEKQEEIIRQKEIQKENERLANEAKIKKYHNNDRYERFISKKDRVINCPLRKIALHELKISKFYQHPVLKQIIDGSFWNGEIYVDSSHQNFIFVNNRRIILPPLQLQLDNQVSEKLKTNRLLHAGLSTISRIIANQTFGDCINCKFYVDSYYLAGEKYKVCNHSTNKQQLDETN
jgi:hypothetical protein